MTTIKLSGNTYGWQRTNVWVRRGDVISIAAEGTISFAVGGWVRGPDGRDEHNAVEEPASRWDSQEHGVHPAGPLIKNSLVCKVGNWMFQGGSAVQVTSRARGELLLAVNDNHTGDNQGAWQARVSTAPNLSGKLHQHLLLIARNLNASERNVAVSMMNRLVTAIKSASNGRIELSFRVVEINAPIDLPAEIRPCGKETGQFLIFSRILQRELAAKDLDPGAFGGIFCCYPQPQGLPRVAGCTQKHRDDYIGDGTKGPPYTAFPVEELREQRALDVLVHEYLHQVNYSFVHVGHPHFADPHHFDIYHSQGHRCLGGNRPGDYASYYAKMLRHMPNDCSAPPYWLLDPYVGVWE